MERDRGDVRSSEPTQNEKIGLEPERILPGMNKWAKEKKKRNETSSAVFLLQN
jgi:hypothetical protein